MAVETEWSLDYCLACDRQTAGGTYCCQSCRLADLETSSCGPEPVSPSTSEVFSPPQDQGLRLSQTFDSATQRRPNYYALSLSTRVQANQPIIIFSTRTVTTDATLANRVLSPSSSRSSLSSTSSKSAQDCHLSAQARTELRGYSNSFDLIRNWRRRMTSL